MHREYNAAEIYVALNDFSAVQWLDDYNLIVTESRTGLSRVVVMTADKSDIQEWFTCYGYSDITDDIIIYLDRAKATYGALNWRTRQIILPPKYKHIQYSDNLFGVFDGYDSYVIDANRNTISTDYNYKLSLLVNHCIFTPTDIAHFYAIYNIRTKQKSVKNMKYYGKSKSVFMFCYDSVLAIIKPEGKIRRYRMLDLKYEQMEKGVKISKKKTNELVYYGEIKYL